MSSKYKLEMFPTAKTSPPRSAAYAACKWKTSSSAGGIQVQKVDAYGVHQMLLGPAFPGLSRSTKQLVHRWPTCVQYVQHTVNTFNPLYVHKPTCSRYALGLQIPCARSALLMYTRELSRASKHLETLNKWLSFFSIWRSFIYHIHASCHAVPLSLEWQAGMRKARGIIYIHYFCLYST